MSASLVGSEMCIRDSGRAAWPTETNARAHARAPTSALSLARTHTLSLIHTDAADDMQCVDLGGR
eukprot:8142096-Alexandrium_andersonii.AAC.1